MVCSLWKKNLFGLNIFFYVCPLYVVVVMLVLLESRTNVLFGNNKVH